jgi:glycerate 2-kinase
VSTPEKWLFMLPERFLTTSLRAHPQGAGITRVLSAAIQAVDPYQAVLRHLRREGHSIWVGEQAYELDSFEHIWLVGAGKAGYPMARAALEVLGERVSGGVVIVKEGYAPPKEALPGIELYEAGHPLPDARGVQATRRLISVLERAGPRDWVVSLISGGGSALLTAPAPGITLDEFQGLTGLLLACGADIGQINCLRKHVDTIKGGGLARLAAPARVTALILSDVVGDPLDVIASGPAVPDPSTFGQAWSVLEDYDVLEKIPASIRARLQSGLDGQIPETPKPGDALFERVQNQIVCSNYQAAQAGLVQAAAEGWGTLLLTTFLQGEARQAGRMLGAIARQAAHTGEPLRRPFCLAAGGETTVTLRGNGKGGRNQEVAIGAAQELDGLENVILVALATDGGDGPTDAAGAVVSGETLRRARDLGLDGQDYLRRNDAYHFFAPLGDLLLPGPTQTNVNDLTFLFGL